MVAMARVLKVSTTKGSHFLVPAQLNFNFTGYTQCIFSPSRRIAPYMVRYETRRAQYISILLFSHKKRDGSHPCCAGDSKKIAKNAVKAHKIWFSL